MKTILISILSFIVGMFAYMYIDLLNHDIYGDGWANFKKDAMKYFFK